MQDRENTKERNAEKNISRFRYFALS